MEELQHAVKVVANGIEQSRLLACDLGTNLIQQCMHTRVCPPVDLLIRTSGEHRLSDFLLWQTSHAQLQWVPCLWPELSYYDLLRCIMNWQQALPALTKIRQAAQVASKRSGSHTAGGVSVSGNAANGVASSLCMCTGALETRSSETLSCIWEESPLHCPHPSSDMRVEGFLSQLDAQRSQWIEQHSTAVC